MKVLFLNPPFLPRFSRSQRSPAVTKSGTLYYPLWLSYAAGVLEDENFEVKLLDAIAEDLSHSQTIKIAKNFLPELIVIDTSTPSIYNDVEIAGHLKDALPNSLVVLVGTHVSALPDETFSLSKNLDVIARNEYDFTILEIAQSLKNNNLDLKNITGISYRNQSKDIIHNPSRPVLSCMDKLPFVSRVYKKHLNINKYFFAASVYPEVQILTARGCPFQCFFCLWPQTFQGRNYRTRSARSVLDEFIYIKENLPEVKGVVIEDDTFTVDKTRTIQICDLLIKNRIRLKWNANVRFDLDIETMKIMKEAGCYLIITGIESSENLILGNIAKGLKESDIKNFFDNAKKIGLLVHAAFMSGNPGETRQSLKKNLDLAKKVMPDTVQFFPLMPYPGTGAYNWARDNNYLRINDFRDYLTKDGLHNCVIELPGLTRKEILGWCDRSRRLYYCSPGYIIYKLIRLFLNPGEIIRTYKAFMKFRRYILKIQKDTPQNGVSFRFYFLFSI